MESVLERALRKIDDASACRVIEPGIETGLPWYDRHAIWGGKEIMQWSRDATGYDVGAHIYGATWTSNEAIRAYYREDARLGNPPDVHAPGIEEGCISETSRFATWQEAERWLFAKEA